MHTPSLVTRDQGQHHAQATPAIAAGLLRTKQYQDPKTQLPIGRNTGYTQKNGAVSKVNKKFLTLHGHNVHHQQRQLSKFLMRYQQFASRAYCGAAGPVSKMASQQEKAFCVLRFVVSRSVITVQREFRARFGKDAPCVFSKPCTKLTLH